MILYTFLLYSSLLHQLTAFHSQQELLANQILHSRACLLNILIVVSMSLQYKITSRICKNILFYLRYICGFRIDNKLKQSLVFNNNDIQFLS